MFDCLIAGMQKRLFPRWVQKNDRRTLVVGVARFGFVFLAAAVVLTIVHWEKHNTLSLMLILGLLLAGGLMLWVLALGCAYCKHTLVQQGRW